MSDSSLFPVHLGTWTNWSRGPIFGATLTLTRRDANLAIAFAAFFVTYVGTRFWRIICLLLHRSFSTPHPRDALHHQRQAVLRNSTSPEAGAYDLLMLAWAWRGRARQLWRRTLPLITLSTAMLGAWVVASGFSSHISLSDIENEVLLSGLGCGWLNASKHFNMTDVYLYLFTDFSDQLSSAANYAQQCYQTASSGDASKKSKGSGVLDCATFVERHIPTTVNADAPCPFKGGDAICRSPTGNLVVDTGLVDSHSHFGLNDPPENRFSFRQVLSCAPLKTEGFTSVFNSSAERSYTRYHYGDLNVDGGSNITYQYSNDRVSDRPPKGIWTAYPDYSMRVLTASTINGTLEPEQSDFVPIPLLQPPNEPMDADVILVFLSANDIQYSAPVTDPWYRATTPVGHIAATNISQLSGQTHGTYAADEPASPLGCRRQVQFCNSAGDTCTPLTGHFDIYDSPALRRVFPTDDALKAWEWTYRQVWGRTIPLEYVPATLGSRSLLSRSGLSFGSQGPLPDNQWQLDVRHWQDTELAVYQSLFVQGAAGPMSRGMYLWFQEPGTEQERAICGSQKIKTKEYASFSLFGIYTILLTGILIALISWVLDPILVWLHRRTGRGEYQLIEWSSNGTLQLQRLAHEEVGSGQWDRGLDFVPVTTRGGDLLAGLDLSITGHPRLQQSRGDLFGYQRSYVGLGLSAGRGRFGTFDTTASGWGEKRLKEVDTKESTGKAAVAVVVAENEEAAAGENKNGGSEDAKSGVEWWGMMEREKRSATMLTRTYSDESVASPPRNLPTVYDGRGKPK